MKKPDTLVISGGSTKVICFSGVFRALFEKGVLDTKLSTIKEIHTLSIGTFYSYCLLLGFSEKVIYECLIQSDFKECLDIDSVDFNGVISTMGLLSHAQYFKKIMKTMMNHKFQKKDITLKELYEYNPIDLYVKCVNISQQSSIHFNHKTHPDMSITELLIMTTSLPVLFRPYHYRGDYYIDGGISGNLAIEKIKSKRTLCIHIKRSLQNLEKEEYPLLGLLLNMCSVSSLSYKKYQKRTINVVVELSTYDFNIDREKKDDLIKEAYEKTMKRINDKNFYFTPL